VLEKLGSKGRMEWGNEGFVFNKVKNISTNGGSELK
jgi:hypothetical protein